MIRGTGAALAAIWFLGAPAWAQQGGQQPQERWQDPKMQDNRFGVVLIQNEPVFALAPVGGYTPETRAEEVRRRILRVLAPNVAGQTTVEAFRRSDIVATRMYGSWVVSFKGIAVATVTPADMHAHNQTGQGLAQQWASQLQSALVDRLNISSRTAFNQVATQLLVAVATPQQIASGNLEGVPGFTDDERLAYAIRGQLASEPALAPLDVDVLNGVVTIRGAVPNRAAERRVKEAIEGLSGVEEVRSDLRIEGR